MDKIRTSLRLLQHEHVHFADGVGTLCGAAGPSTRKVARVRCHACLSTIRADRQQRLQEEAAQAEINAILAKRAAKLADRIRRAQERRSNGLRKEF